MEETKIVEYEKKWIDGLNRGDVSVADEVFARECKIHFAGSNEHLSLADFKEKVKRDLDKFPGMQFTIKDQIIADDRFVFRWIANGFLLKEGPIQVEGLILDKVENDKVVERWEKKRLLPLTPDKCCMIVPYFAVLSGKLDEFKGLCKELVTRTSKEPNCLYYGFSFDEHNEHNAHCREGYVDADGLLYHLGNVKDLLEKVEKIAVTYRLEIHGPKEELEKLKTLREELKQYNPMFFTLEKGFRKAIVEGNEGERDANNPSKESSENPELDQRGLQMYENYFGDKFKGDPVGLRRHTINHLFAHIYSKSEISLRDRCMITVALLALQRRETQLKKHMQAAVKQNICKGQIFEILGHVGNYVGLEAEVFGIRIACAYYNEKTSGCNEPDELTEKERCMIKVSLAATQGREEQLREQMKEAKNSGITFDQMLEVAIHVAHYAGWPTGNFIQEIAGDIYKKNH